MSNTIYYHLDVLASSPAEIAQIASSLREPSTTLVTSVAFQQPVSEVAHNLKTLLAFTATENLGYLDNSVNKAQRFRFSFPAKYCGIVDSHLLEVSEAFPSAIFLLEYHDPQDSSSGKSVIRAGDMVGHIHDGDHKAQAVDWVLLDIFAPFRSEYDAGLKFGSLWHQWLDDMLATTNELKASGWQLPT